MNTELAREITHVRGQVAKAVTDTFLARHPDWIERYGERARAFGEEDAGHHLDFVAASVELGSPQSFVDYSIWCRGVLDSRGIDVAFLLENLHAIEDELRSSLSAAAFTAASAAVRAGLGALEAAAAPPEPGPLSLACRLYSDAAVAGRRKDALAIVREALHETGSLLDVYVDIFQDALYEIGRRWASTGLTVAEEHMATATTQFILSVLYENAAPAAAKRGNAILTGVAGELHQVGANIVADALDADGWDVRFLGTNMPQAGILDAIEEHQPALVGISATIPGNVGTVGELIAAIRDRPGDTPRILVGGGAFRANPGIWREVGADGFSPDVRAAVEAARA